MCRDKVVAVSALPTLTSLRRSTGEVLGTLACISEPLNLQSVVIHHETLPSGHRSSPPHRHSLKEECVYVLDGNPSVWIDGEVRVLQAGDCVGFPPGSREYHMLFNSTDRDAKMLVIDTQREGDTVTFYQGEVCWK